MAALNEFRATHRHAFTREQIGILKIGPNVVRERHYDVAAWWTKIAIDPGTYPVYCTHDGTQSPHVYVTVPGTVIDEYMPTLFGGVVITNGYGHRNVGRRTTLIVDGCEYAENPFANALGMIFERIPIDHNHRNRVGDDRF